MTFRASFTRIRYYLQGSCTLGPTKPWSRVSEQSREQSRMINEYLSIFCSHFVRGYPLISSPYWCLPERLFTNSTSRCLGPDSRARIIPGAEPQITMPAGI